MCNCRAEDYETIAWFAYLANPCLGCLAKKHCRQASKQNDKTRKYSSYDKSLQVSVWAFLCNWLLVLMFITATAVTITGMAMSLKKGGSLHMNKTSPQRAIEEEIDTIIQDGFLPTKEQWNTLCCRKVRLNL